jgi:hypothetical protein
MRIFFMFFGENHKEIIYYTVLYDTVMRSEVKTLVICPLCQKNTVGKVGSSQYYCWECFVEFLIQKDKIVVYEVCDDGTLLPYDKDNNQLTMGG